MSRVIQKQKVQSYQELLSLIRQEIATGHQSINDARAQTYWKIGRHIARHLLLNKQRAAYGEKLFSRLAVNLQVDRTTLHRAVKFYETYPISAARHQLGWSHYKQLLGIESTNQRNLLENKVIQNNLSSRQLEKEIRQQKEKKALSSFLKNSSKSLQPLKPLKGLLNTYQITQRPTFVKSQEATPTFYLDLGFKVFRELERHLNFRLQDKMIVEIDPAFDRLNLKISKRTLKDLFTYAAIVEKVIDADTLKVRIKLPLKQWITQTLRLRGIDCPELSTPQGRAAKRYVVSMIKKSSKLFIRSSHFSE